MLREKNAIVTGCNRGIGKAIVEEFAKNGCNIWACARKENAEFEAYIAELAKANNVRIKPIYFDLASEEEIKAGFMKIRKDRQSVDILVNNAGIAYSGILSLTSMKKVREIFEVNVFSIFALTQLTLNLMIRQKAGSIVNIASIVGKEGHHGDSVYGASKAAVEAFTRVLAAEAADFGIRVNAVAPGYTDTDMSKTHADLINENILPTVAMGRLARPEEIARAVRFLVSDEASFINGETLRVDGGKR